MEPVKLRRSVLFTPGSNVHALEKARDLPADVIVFDLEDAVGPEEKEVAREQVVQALAGQAYEGRELAVRINAADSLEGAADLEAILPYAPDVIVLPKVDDPEVIARVCAVLDVAQTPRGLALWAMIETPKGMLHLREIAETGARRRLSALMVGVNDLGESLGVPRGRRRWALHPLLMQIIAAARAHSLLVFDGVYNEHADLAGFAREAAEARAMGFDGKTLIHPAQIAPCHEAFRPSSDELDFARRVVAAFRVPENLKSGAIDVDGRMVERLHFDAAKRVLAMAGEDVDA
jgi:citrate lyase subunit beta/citryl-CoA lyase